MKKLTNLTKFILLCSVVLSLCIGESLVAWRGRGYGHRGYRRGYGYGHRGYRRGYGYGHRGYRRGYGYGRGAAIGAGVGLGALAIGGAIAASNDNRAEKDYIRERARQDAQRDYDRKQLRSNDYENTIEEMDYDNPDVGGDDNE